MIRKNIIGFLAKCGATLFISMLVGLPVMWVWNGLIPEITGWKVISYGEAIRLFLLCDILLGSIGKPEITIESKKEPSKTWREKLDTIQKQNGNG